MLALELASELGAISDGFSDLIGGVAFASEAFCCDQDEARGEEVLRQGLERFFVFNRTSLSDEIVKL